MKKITRWQFKIGEDLKKDGIARGLKWVGTIRSTAVTKSLALPYVKGNCQWVCGIIAGIIYNGSTVKQEFTKKIKHIGHLPFFAFI